MEETKRQKMVGRLIQEELSQIFLREGKEVTGNAMVTISNVRMTPDLLTARVYLSIFNAEDPDEIMYFIEANNKQFRRLLGNKIRHQVRRIPELAFFKDESLDEVFKLEEIFKQLKEEKEAKKEDPEKPETDSAE